MDIAKYSLAEIYSLEKFYDIALEKLSAISDKSYYFLPKNLKVLSVKKLSKKTDSYQKLLFKNLEVLPRNESIL